MSHVAEAVTRELLDDEGVSPRLDRIHRTLGVRCKRGCHATLQREWNALTGRAVDMTDAVNDLVHAMEIASEYGYSWEQTGWYEYDAPYVGDDRTDAYMSPYIQEFSTLYLSSCVFMTRDGQRSQPVVHEELDAFSGRTRVQEQTSQMLKKMRKRQREHERQRAREAETSRKRRREELETQIREAQSEMSTLA